MHASNFRQFSNIDVSQGSSETRLRCGGIVNDHFVAYLPVNLKVKKLWKSVNIWQSYGQYYSGLFFWLTVYILLRCHKIITITTGALEQCRRVQRCRSADNIMGGLKWTVNRQVFKHCLHVGMIWHSQTLDGREFQTEGPEALLLLLLFLFL